MSTRADVHLRSLFQELNPSKLLVFSSTLAFAVLFALKLDDEIACSWFVVFAPLFIWKAIAVAGAIVGTAVFLRRPRGRVEAEECLQYKAMLVTLALHLLLLMFELLAADNLATKRLLWSLVFLPLLLTSLLSFFVCIWSIRHERNFELELFFCVNFLQFVFISLKLDNVISWPWEIAFVPLWIVLCVSLVGVLYSIIFAGILLRMPEVNIDHRRNSTNSALGYSLLVVPLLVFLVLLTNKLDRAIKITYFSACTPLYFTLVVLILTAFGSRGGNQYWFGLRKPPCQFLFTACPCLQLFGNISYSLQLSPTENNESNTNNNTSIENSDSAAGAEAMSSKTTNMALASSNEQVVPALAINMPD